MVMVRERSEPGVRSSPVRFREVQPLSANPILRIALGIDLAVVAVGVGVMVVWSGGAGPWPPGAMLVAVGVLFPIAMILIRLVTVVTDERLEIRFRPLPGRSIPLTSIRSAEVVRYDPIASGGWGWRVSSTWHRIFSVSGDRGVHVQYGEGRGDRFLVGSQRADELAELLGGPRPSEADDERVRAP